MEASESRLHAFEYQHEGETWIVEIPATSEADAWQRVCRLQEGKYLGEVQTRIAAGAGGGLISRVACGVANAWTKMARI